MTTSPLEVLIAGGGIGGLCLAHGLRRAGIAVRVLERTRSRTDWLQGYRLHIDPAGSTALHDCLSPRAWARFCDSVSDEANGFALRTETMRPLFEMADAGGDDPDPARRHHGLSRIALRESLLTDLDDVVELGRTVTGYTIESGRAVAQLEDGETVTADLLVGADGANSRIRLQLLPRAVRRELPVLGLAGKYRVGSDTDVAEELRRGVTIVLPPRQGFMFIANWQGARRNAAVPVGAPEGFLFDTTSDYVFWAYADRLDALGPRDRLEAMTGEQRIELLSREIADWAPELRGLVAGSEPDTVGVVPMRSATRVRPWPTGPVTLLGDALHHMTPMAGVGANTALRDAGELTAGLRAVRNGQTDLRTAVAAYERATIGYGFRAVAESERNARLAGSRSRLQRGAIRSGAMIAGALRRR